MRLSAYGTTPPPTASPTPSTTASPTPSPSATQNATPLPSPSPTNPCTYWRLTAPTQSGEGVSIEYIPCGGELLQVYDAWWGTGTHNICAVVGSVTVNDLGIDGTAVDTGNPCT